MSKFALKIYDLRSIILSTCVLPLVNRLSKAYILTLKLRQKEKGTIRTFYRSNDSLVAGALGLEPRTNGFGDRDSTN